MVNRFANSVASSAASRQMICERRRYHQSLYYWRRHIASQIWKIRTHEDVDPDQMLHDFIRLLLLEHLSRPQDSARLVKVEAGYDEFLDGKASHLDLLVDVVDVMPFGRVRYSGVGL